VTVGRSFFWTLVAIEGMRWTNGDGGCFSPWCKVEGDGVPHSSSSNLHWNEFALAPVNWELKLNGLDT